MTTTTQHQKRLSELERTDTSQKDPVYVWRGIIKPGSEDQPEPTLSAAFGRGWSAERREGESPEDFKNRCITTAAEAGIEITFEEQN
ncbi:MAG: hypothetical protein ACJAVM_002129 [Sulfitobacter sp.]|jgi:hypothetical protein